MTEEQPVDLDVAACLRAAYGVTPPPMVVDRLRLAFEHATREGYVDDTDYLTYGGLGFEIAGLAQRPVWPDCDAFSYPCTPPELFVFGSAGVDGIHYGFVVHDPETPTPYPVAVMNPMEADAGVRGLGASSMLADAGGTYAFDPAWPKLSPAVPEGWRHEPTRDGIGVLAPAEAFGDAPSLDVGYYAELGPVERAATVALMKGHPATSLQLLREFFAHNHHGDAVAARATLRLMAQAYRSLDRPLLADVALRHAEQHWPKR